MKLTQNQAHHPVIDEIVREAISRKFIHRIWLFGSRARQDHRPESDIDLAFEFNSNEEGDTWIRFKDWVQNESNTLLQIDIVNMRDCSADLKDQILNEGICLYDKFKTPAGVEKF